MATVHEDIIDGASVEVGEDGYTATRSFLVSDLTGNANAWLYNATRAPGIPSRGDAHPAIPGIQADGISASPEQRDSVVRVTVTYRTLEGSNSLEGASDLELQTGLSTKETDRDSRGEQMIVRHKRFVTSTDNTAFGIITINQIVTASVQVPLVRYQVTRKQKKALPVSVAQKFVGRVGGWARGRKHWLCEGISSSKSNGADSYDVTYSFTYDPDGWKFKATARGENGQPYEGAKVEEFDVYKQADFTELPIPAPLE